VAIFVIMDENPELIYSSVSAAFDLPPIKRGKEELLIQLESAIDKLLQTDFPRLIDILYRLDVDELKLKNELKENPDSKASLLIANLVLARQMQILETRKKYGRKEDIPDDEKW